MEVKFIGQGLSLPSDKPAGDVINNILESSNYQEFSAFVAFASVGGIKQILPNLKNHIKKDGTIRLYVGVDLHGTSKEALELLIAENIPTYIVFSPNRVVYHPKIYTFEGDNKYFVIVGSSNLTTSGLYQNVEASLCVCNEYEDEDGKGRELLSDIYDYYNNFINGESTTCQLLTEEILDTLVKTKVVLPEKTLRAVNNSHSEVISTAQLSDVETLNKTFAKLKIKSPKSSTKKSVKTQIMKAGDKDIMIHTASAVLSGNSMWIETREMTGGSRNILDLSAQGKLDSVKKFGSVDFFGIDKTNHSITKDINLVYNGKIYKNNTILYGHGNNNWRLQIKGETVGGLKMTDISSPKLGVYGGFQHKILIFEKTSVANKYNFYILDESELDNMISQSSDWARGGNGQGRAYGLINSTED